MVTPKIASTICCHGTSSRQAENPLTRSERLHMGQFSMTISAVAGSNLSGNQHTRDRRCSAMKRWNCGRDSFLRNTTKPSAVAPCNCITFFAKSTPRMPTSPMDALFVSLCFETTSLAHRDAVRGMRQPAHVQIFKPPKTRLAVLRAKSLNQISICSEGPPARHGLRSQSSTARQTYLTSRQIQSR